MPPPPPVSSTRTEIKFFPDFNIPAGQVPQSAGSGITVYITDNTTSTTTTYTVPISGYTAGPHSVLVPIGLGIISGHSYKIAYEGTTGGANNTGGSAQGIMYWDFVGPRGPWGANPPATITLDPEVTITVPNQGWYPGMFDWQITEGSPAYACGRTAITAIPDPALPVTLLSFTATLQNTETVLLQWSTAMELNNDYFTIQRSVDGVNFEDLEVVDGNGTHNGILNYQRYDYHALSGISYYRLKQTDFDGRISFSSVATISNTGSGVSFALYPTLTTSGSQITVKVTGVGPNEKVSIVMYDMLARNIYNYMFTTDASGNILSTITLPQVMTQGTYVAEASFQNREPVRAKLVVVQ